MARRRNTVTYVEQNQMIVRQYREHGEPWPATMTEVAAWAIRKGLWKAHPDSIVRQCANDLADAMREEYITDPRGRKVRAKHAARVTRDGQQIVLWADIRSAEPEHMRTAFQQRRHQIIGDCRQLKWDVDSYNENTNKGLPIQLILDFTDDVAEYDIMDGLGVSSIS